MEKPIPEGSIEEETKSAVQESDIYMVRNVPVTSQNSVDEPKGLSLVGEVIEEPVTNLDSSVNREKLAEKKTARTDSSVSFGSRASSRTHLFRFGTRRYSCNPHEKSHGVHREAGYERAAFQRERRVAKSLSLVVGGYILCWLPFFLVYLMKPFLPDDTIPPLCEACFVWLGWVNSAINPFIYALNNNDFKKAFLRLTIHKVRKWRRRGEMNTNNFV